MAEINQPNPIFINDIKIIGTTKNSLTFKYLAYEIDLINEIDYHLDSLEHKFEYDKEYCINYDADITSKHGIILRHNNEILNTCIILNSVGKSTIHKNSFLIEKNDLLLCVGNSVCRISIPLLKIMWHKEIDPVCCCGIYKIQESIILYGASTISKLNVNYDNVIITEWQKVFNP